MRTFHLFCLAAFASVSSFTSASAETTKAKGKKPAASPGWLIIEEDAWEPLWYEPMYTFDDSRYHYRRREEKAAANKIDKAVSWLKLAEGHAEPITKEKLTAAAKDLEIVAKDLRSGSITSAAKMDAALAKAAAALSEWHYYKAHESYGKGEEKVAGHDLALAARYLQHAANSARYQFGSDTSDTITDYYDNGWWIGETKTYDHNTLGRDLQTIQKGIKDLGNAMKSVK